MDGICTCAEEFVKGGVKAILPVQVAEVYVVGIFMEGAMVDEEPKSQFQKVTIGDAAKWYQDTRTLIVAAASIVAAIFLLEFITKY